ncbi:ABC transporter ATP-binding protein [Phreatobacter stygius]|uniref:ABC transporter ATP-binding protein n=1 Tax=Phreatobacter stygius TaxID=1940610 RepID=A0A4D7B1I0_9HYPH|nr:ABC transporter ATP-binding protein [Phreatobacter stygius]QCI63890.1 ABC transporter ATP-binding protein [Phreatobacter stygius]
MSVVLEADGLGIAFGGVKAVDGVSFKARAGEILAIIGPNGAGKTTLFNMVSGVYLPKSGRVLMDGVDVTGLEPHLLAARGLSRTFQNLQIFFRMSAVENVMVGCHLREKRGVLAHLVAWPSVGRQNRETRAKALALLDLVGLKPLADLSAGSLPYGALKRLEIARALAVEPKLVLLDEPAAGCNPVETEEIDRVIHGIAARGIGVVLVEHDMKLVMKISNRILVLDHGKPLAEGSPREVRANPDVIRAYLGGLGAREAAHAQG